MAERERDASACKRRHQAFALAPVRERDASTCIRRHQDSALPPVLTVAVTVTAYDDDDTDIKSVLHCHRTVEQNDPMRDE